MFRERESPRSNQPLRLPVARTLFAIAIAGPALYLGGVPTQVVSIFTFLVGLCCLRLIWRGGKRSFIVPSGTILGVLAVFLTCLALVPLPTVVLETVCPDLHRLVNRSLASATNITWSQISVSPGNTALEAVRLLALTALFVAAAQFSWRHTATFVVIAGLLVTAVGFAHELSDTQAIYGFYAPRDRTFTRGLTFLTSFVNSNHQASLLLLSLFSSLALGADARDKALHLRERELAQRYADRYKALYIVATVLAASLILSLSRAAMIAAAIVGVGAVALHVAAYVSESSKPKLSRIALKGGLTSAVAVALVGIGSRGAWSEFATLGQPGALQLKYETALTGLRLIPYSPVFGIGRGAFVEAFPLVDHTARKVVVSHLESSPLAMLVEWGVLGGTVMVLGFAYWWIRTYRQHKELGRKIAMLGLLGVAIHSLADFNLEYLGVGAPVVALAGSLSPPLKSWRTSNTRYLVLGVALVTCATGALAHAVQSTTWPHLREKKYRIHQAGSVLSAKTAKEQLRWHPIDADLYARLAREALDTNNTLAAIAQSRVALAVDEFNANTHFTLAQAYRVTGDEPGTVDHLRRAIATLRNPPSDEIIAFILDALPSGFAIESIAPEHTRAWRDFALALARTTPKTAGSLANAREKSHPNDSAPANVLAVLAFESGQYPLALHHSRLFAHDAPSQSSAYRFLEKTYAKLGRKLHHDRQFQMISEAGIEKAGTAIDRPIQVREILIRSYLRTATRNDLQRADELLIPLMYLQMPLKQRKRLANLRREIRQAEAVHNSK